MNMVRSPLPGREQKGPLLRAFGALVTTIAMLPLRSGQGKEEGGRRRNEMTAGRTFGGVSQMLRPPERPLYALAVPLDHQRTIKCSVAGEKESESGCVRMRRRTNTDFFFFFASFVLCPETATS